jgi:2-keto-3-deoxy-galactonokinase
MALLKLSGTVQMVCTPALAALYDRALAPYSVTSTVIDGDAAALAGLVHIQAELN